MKKIGFIGFGNIGKQIKLFLEEKYNNTELQYYYFDDKTSGSSEYHFGFNTYLEEQHRETEFYICLGYSHLLKKKEIITSLMNAGRKVPSFVHFSCYIHPTAKLGAGVYLWPMCNLDKDVQIGPGTLMYNGSIVCHDSTVGSCSFFGASVTISGDSNVGDCTFLGTKVAVADEIHVGSEVKAAIGSVITWNVPDKTNVFGYPLKKISRLNLKR